MLRGSEGTHVLKVLIVVGENVCEMLIRHECCGVGAPGSGGGTPCATRRDGGALVLQEPSFVRMARKHMGPELENSTVLEGNINAMLRKSEVGACDRGEAAGRAAAEPFSEGWFLFSLDEITVRVRNRRSSEVSGKMRGNNDSCCIICFINVLIIRYTNGGGGGSSNASLRRGAWREFITEIVVLC